MTARDNREDLDKRIDAIESAYEYFLAYAAQGRTTDSGAGGANSDVREHLESMRSALDGLAGVAQACAAELDPGLVEGTEAFIAAIENDSSVAGSIVSLVLAKSDISSQLIDNLNASIHIRALLTDLFVIDEALKNKVT